MLIEYKQVVLDDKVIVPLPSIPIKQFSSTHQSLSKCLGCKIPPPHRRNAFPIAFETRGSEASSRPSCCSETGQFQIA